MGTGTSLAKDRIRSSQSPVHVHSGTPSTGASQIQVTTEDGRGLLRLGSADIPSGSAAAGQSLPYGQTSSRSTSTQPSLPSGGSSSSENEMEEEVRNLPTPPLVRTTRGACAERFDAQSTRRLVGKCVQSLEKGFGLSLRREELLRSAQEVRWGPGKVILARGEPSSGVFIILDGRLEVMAPREKIVLCRLEPEEFCGEISTFFHIPCTASVRTQSLSTSLVLLPSSTIADTTGDEEVATYRKLLWCCMRSYVDTASMFETGHLSRMEITNCLRSPNSEFSSWSTEALNHIALKCTPMLFGSGDELCRAGERLPLIYLVFRGTLQFSDAEEATSSTSHMRTTIKSSSEGYCIGTKELFSGVVMTRTITAVSPLLTVPVTKNTLQETVDKFPSNGAKWRELYEKYKI